MPSTISSRQQQPYVAVTAPISTEYRATALPQHHTALQDSLSMSPMDHIRLRLPWIFDAVRINNLIRFHKKGSMEDLSIIRISPV
jgi:hypothetical protein